MINVGSPLDRLIYGWARVRYAMPVIVTTRARVAAREINAFNLGRDAERAGLLRKGNR